MRLETEVEEARERGRRAEGRVAALDDTQRTRATAREAAEADRLSASKDLEQVVREGERVGLMLEAVRSEVAELRGDATSVETEARTQRQMLADVEATAARVASEITELLGRIEVDSQDEGRRSQAFLVWILAQVSRSATVRLKTGRSGVESGSRQK